MPQICSIIAARPTQMGANRKETEMNEDMQGVLRRIQKLLAIAGDARADANEAASAAAMAEKLMRKFQLDNADVMAADLRSKRERAVKAPAFANMKRGDAKRPPVQQVPGWGQHLAVAVARLHDCEVRLGRAARPGTQNVQDACLWFFGTESDVAVVVWTFDYLVGAMLRGCAQFNADAVRAGTPSKAASESFRRGFVAAVTAALRAATAEKARAAYAGGSALVVAKRAAIVEQFGEFKYGAAKTVSVSDAAAFVNGRAAGARVDVMRRAVSGSAAPSVARLSA